MPDDVTENEEVSIPVSVAKVRESSDIVKTLEEWYQVISNNPSVINALKAHFKLMQLYKSIFSLDNLPNFKNNWSEVIKFFSGKDYNSLRLMTNYSLVNWNRSEDEFDFLTKINNILMLHVNKGKNKVVNYIDFKKLPFLLPDEAKQVLINYYT